jgi:preprotein translocase subunit SecA
LAVAALLAHLISWFGEQLSRYQLRELDQLQVLYGRMNDQQLRAEFRRQIAPGKRAPRTGIIGLRWLDRRRDDPTLHAVAIAACLFDRHPCDLPAGSRIYDEQRVAALMLLDQTNVQMATGEGKTYAIALAAAALLARFPQVVVVTANDYLARRDQRRAMPFLDAAGLACAEGVPVAEFRGVAYTTLSDLCFAYLKRTYRGPDSTQPEYPNQAAVIIDEIDSVLLDQGLGHVLGRRIPSEENLWADVFGLTDDWDERQYTYDPVWDTVSLTADAWEEVAALSHTFGKPAALLIDLVAAVLWARQAVEGSNYAIEDGNIRLISRVTGQTYETSGPQQAALEYLIMRRSPALWLEVAEINGLTLLRRHPHVVGLSGTASEDTLYYLQQLGTLTGEVPPRFPRYQSKFTTLVADSRKRTLRHVADRIQQVSPRPVVIGTWSPSEARMAAEWLLATGVVAADRLAVVTSFDSATDATAVDRSGEPGRVTVLSQGGSRGVDVRSTHRPLLIILGRAAEPRLDRQFLGRVGRHGEPFEAEFLMDPSSPIWFKQLGFASRMAGGLVPLGRAEERLMRKAQHEVWLRRYRRRQQASVLSDAIGRVEATVAADLERIRQAGAAELRSHVTDLVAELPQPQSGEARPDAAGSAQLEEQVVAAIERRVNADQLVREFQDAVRDALADGSGVRPDGYRFTIGTPNELVALTRWLRRQTIDNGRDTSGDRAALLRRQAELAASQRLPVRTIPHWRDPLDIEYETRLMANVTLNAQMRHRLDSLRVSASRETYYRRGAFAVRNLHQLSELRVRLEVLNNLLLVDRPDQLGELYYSRDHRLADSPNSHPPEESPAEAATEPPVPPPATGQLADGDVEALVQEFLALQEQEPDRAALHPDYARLLLRDLLQPLVSGQGAMGTATLRRQVDLVIDALAAKGASNAELRRIRRLIRDFSDYLYRAGVLPARLTYATPLASGARRIRGFLATIPLAGVAAVLGYLGVLGLGLLLVVGQARRVEVLDTAADLFGFGAVLGGRPVLVLFAVVTTCHAVLRAMGLSDPNLLISRVAPLLAITVAFVGYGQGLSNLVPTVLLALALIFWLAILLLVHGFVKTLVGADISAILAAGSVTIYLANAVAHGEAQVGALVLVGVVAAVAGPALPVSVMFREYTKGRFQHADDRARIRIPIDPALASGLVAYVVVVLTVGVRGPVAIGGFAVLQLLVLVFFAIRRLRVERVAAMLARLRVGSPLSDDRLRRYLLHAVTRTVLVAAAVLAAAAIPIILAGGSSVTVLLLAEWAGVRVVMGLLAGASIFSVAGAAAPPVDPQDDEVRPFKLLMERLRSWWRRRFGWLFGTAGLLVLLARPLGWIADTLDLVDAAQAIYRMLTTLV